MPRNRPKRSGSIRRARRDKVDRLRTKFWYLSLCGRIGKWTVYMLEKTFEQIPYTMKKGKWRYFRDGRRVPASALVTRADNHPRGKGTAREINHVLWKVLRLDFDLRRGADFWLHQLSPDVQNIFFITDLDPVDGKYYERRRIDGRQLRALERQASLDSLACLTILFREACGKNEREFMRIIAESIYRALLIVSQDYPMSVLAGDVFELYAERIFSILPSDVSPLEISSARFAEDSTALAYQFACTIEHNDPPTDSWPARAALFHDILRGKYHEVMESEVWELPKSWSGPKGLRPLLAK